MVELRVFGVIVAFLSLLGFYWIYRRRGGKAPILLGVIFCVSLSWVALFPRSLDAVLVFFTDTDQQFSRMVILLIISTIVLTVLLVRVLFVTNFQERRFRTLAMQLSLERFEDHHDWSEVRSIQVLIPACDEAANLERLLPMIPDRLEDRPVGVLVVSDGSRDSTLKVARDHGAMAVENPVNLGQGASLALGFEICRRGSADIVVTLDADGQHDPREIPRLLTPLLEEDVDFTVGSRVLGEDHRRSTIRRLGTRLFNVVLSGLVGRRITDCSSGFRAFRTDVLEALQYHEPRYLEPEMLMKALSRGFDCREVPVTVSARWEGGTKKPGDFRYGWGFFGVILRHWWSS